MKILHLIDSAGVYGAESVLLTLVAEQMRQGLKPVIGNISTRAEHPKPLVAECAARGLPHRNLLMPRGYSHSSVRKMVNDAVEEGIDVIHTHGYKGDILLGFYPGRAALPISLVATVHGWTTTRLSNRVAVRVALYEWLDGFALKRMDKVIAVSHALSRHPRLEALPQGKLTVIHNGVPARSADPALSAAPLLDPAVVRFCADAFVIGSIGRLAQEKAQHNLLHATRALRDGGANAKLLLFGAGILENKLLDLARQLGVEDRVMMAGYRRDASSYLPLMSVFALSSLKEGLPIVILEAMRAGVPIVASRVGGIPEALRDGESALLVEAGSADQLTAAIERLMADPGLGRRLAQAAAIAYGNGFSSDSMARRYLDIYRSLPNVLRRIQS